MVIDWSKIFNIFERIKWFKSSRKTIFLFPLLMKWGLYVQSILWMFHKNLQKYFEMHYLGAWPQNCMSHVITFMNNFDINHFFFKNFGKLSFHCVKKIKTIPKTKVMHFWMYVQNVCPRLLNFNFCKWYPSSLNERHKSFL